jgi:hypothetical protein
MTDYSEEQRREILERAYAALDATAGNDERLRERQMANAERRVLGEAGSRAPQAPPADHPVTRTAGPRDWAAESAWVGGIVDAKLAAFSEMAAAGIGEAVGQIRKELRAEFKGQLEGLRAECQALVADALVDVLRGEIGVRLAEISAGLRALDQSIERSAKVDAAFGLRHADTDRPPH